MKSNLLAYFAQTLRSVPDKTAVAEAERSASFRQLAQAAKALGWKLRNDFGGQTRRPVAVLLGKSIESVEADLGVLYSGNAYMNLDIKTPESRLLNVLELVKPLCVVTSKKTLEIYRGGVLENREDLLFIEDLPVDLSPAQEEELERIAETVSDTDPLCLINTSGSTGTPKSVVLSHRSFIDYTVWAVETFHLSPDERLGSIAPIVFDHSSYEFCLMLLHGCTLDFIPESYTMFPARLLQYIAQRRVSYIFWVPTIMVNIANMDLLSRIALPELKMVWFAGEVFPTKQFNYWRRQLPQATFVNLYGPTEITVDCTYYIVERELRDDEPIPIGYPRRNTDILILDEHDRPVQPGQEGELCVRGTALAMGYYNNPEKTAAAFVQNPLNSAYPERIYRTGDIVFVNERGEIIFKGRNDTLIKHMGKRIELGEIEHVIINTLKLVRNGCCVYDYEKKEIVFFYEAEAPLNTAEFRKRIGQALPAYMVPTRYVYLEEMPRNTNGKIDRLKLKNQTASGREQ